MQVYKDRFRSLREVAELATAHGDQTFIVYGDRADRLRRVRRPTANRRRPRAPRRLRRRPRRPRGRAVARTTPSGAWRSGARSNIGAILVGLNGWWKTDEIVYGLQDSGAKVLVADRKRFERIAEHRSTSCPDLEPCSSSTADPPTRPRRRPPRCTASTSSPAAPPPTRCPTTPIDEDDSAVIFYTSGTTGPPEGRDLDPPQHDRQPAEHRSSTRVAGSMTGGGARMPDGGRRRRPSALFTSPLFHVSGCHSTLVVGLLAGAEAGDAGGPVRAREGARADPGRTASRVWATVPTMVWRVCEHPDRHDYDTSTVDERGLRRLAVGRRAAAQGARDVPERAQRPPTPTASPRPSSVATVISGQDAIDKPTSVGPPVPDGRAADRRRQRRRGADRADRRGRDQAARSSCRATGASPRPPPRPITPTAGCTPATSATSTTTASSTSPTARRT